VQVGFDDANTHRKKMCYGRFMKLGGVFVWDGEVDDNTELIKSIKGSYDKASCGDFEEPSC
jgi:GH18 family chitinase